jgi:hypothetical protein
VTCDGKKVWATPELTEFGTVERLTQQCKGKSLGTGDDFATNIQTVTTCAS